MKQHEIKEQKLKEKQKKAKEKTKLKQLEREKLYEPPTEDLEILNTSRSEPNIEQRGRKNETNDSSSQNRKKRSLSVPQENDLRIDSSNSSVRESEENIANREGKKRKKLRKV